MFQIGIHDGDDTMGDARGTCAEKKNAAADPSAIGYRDRYIRELVELRGFEPLTPRLPALCSPN